MSSFWEKLSRQSCRRVGQDFDWGNEPVPVAGNGLDVARFLGRITQCIAQSSHRSIQASVEVHKGAVWPQSSAQFFSGNQFTRTFDEDLKNLEWLILELQPSAVLTQLE